MVQKMMTQIFIAATAFSLSLLAFCAGTWLTVWSGCNTKQYNESSAAKLTGYFVLLDCVNPGGLLSLENCRSDFRQPRAGGRIL